MKLQINYKHLAAEFVIVVIGVAVALAADNWREDLRDRRIEQDYLARLKSELELGQGQVSLILARFGIAAESAAALVKFFETGRELVNATELVEHLTLATRTGGPGAGISHSAVYSELESTGRLNLLSNPQLRVALTNYYRSLEIRLANLDTLPLTIWTRYRELTGQEAGTYINAGTLPTGDAADRLVKELEGGELSVDDFRLLLSRLNLLVVTLESLLQENFKLIELIEQEAQ